MEGKPKPPTGAELQAQRLESMRLAQERRTQESAEKAFDPGRTFVEKTIDRLQSMKAGAARNEAIPGKPSLFHPSPGRLRVRGLWKSMKLTEMQVKALNRLVAKEPNLRKSDVVRIALNRFLGIPNSPAETDWEARIVKLLEQIKRDGK